MIVPVVEQLMRDEGFREHTYEDTEGHLTIGYGINLDTEAIPQDIAELWLTRKISEIEYQLLPLVFNNNYAMTFNPRGAVLTNMAYNLGVKGLLGFTKMLAAFAAGDYDTAAVEMLDSKWAKQVGDRATRLAEQMRTGRWI